MRGGAEAPDGDRLAEAVRCFEESAAFAERVGEKVEKVEAGRAVPYLDAEDCTRTAATRRTAGGARHAH